MCPFPTAPRFPSADGDLRNEILRLEAHIEELAGMLERCRKIALAAKVAVAAGGTWLSAVMLGAVAFDPVAVIGAIGAVVGGTVVFGSNASTSKQTAAAIKAAEASRAELIGGIDLRAVGEAEGC